MQIDRLSIKNLLLNGERMDVEVVDSKAGSRARRGREGELLSIWQAMTWGP